MRALRRQIAAVERWLTAIYRLDLDLRAERFVIGAERARALLPAASPRTGVLVVEGDGEAWLGLYIDPRDAGDAGTIVEETSHLVCLAWHAAQGRRVSQLLLEVLDLFCGNFVALELRAELLSASVVFLVQGLALFGFVDLKCHAAFQVRSPRGISAEVLLELFARVGAQHASVEQLEKALFQI